VLESPIDETLAETARARLVPRFTIRTLLVIITLAAIVFVMIGTATRGQYWAWGVTIGLVSIIITGLAHAAWFGIVWMFMRVSHIELARAESTPPHLGTARAPDAAAETSPDLLSRQPGQPQP
jgi:hypothetical protein